MIKTAGNFDPTDNNIYFLASDPNRINCAATVHNYLLIAIDQLKSESAQADLPRWIADDKKVFIDSGIFNLTMEHVKSHPGLSMNDALALAPDEIDGFDNLLDRYVQIIRTYGSKSWGYIELDQGGRENKIKTRERLEKMGLRPIPVYHPLNDGWDYFDYLAKNYDRICFGNVVQASQYERLRLVATAWERHRRYPDLWIHLLGLTPNEWLYALPINSGDSSSWLSSVKWSGYNERIAGKSIQGLSKNFRYILGSDPDTESGSHKASEMAAYGVHLNQLNWRNAIADYTSLGFEIYPKRE